MRVRGQVTIDTTLQVDAANLYNTLCVTPLIVGSQPTIVTLRDIHASRSSEISLEKVKSLYHLRHVKKGKGFVV